MNKQEVLQYIKGRIEQLGEKAPRIAVLASGGVDSSVAIHLLVEAGYRPTLYYIQIGMDQDGFEDCSWEDDIAFVQMLAKKYALPLEIVSLHNEYWENVVQYTIDSVRKGLTPNPDMMCNKLIKFGCFEEKWGKDFDFIATGHYATTSLIDGKVFLSTAPDPVKDQTDFLAQINFRQISKLIFPIGHLKKEEVRSIALEANLANAQRKDSQGICFLGKVNYNQFIERYLGTKEGRIIEFETGKEIGKHKGFWFHTIGQRKGLGLSGGPWFVVKKNCKKNIVFVSRGYDPLTQYGTKVYTDSIDFITENIWHFYKKELKASLPISLKIRHTPEFVQATLRQREEGDYLIESEEKIQGIAPGQYAVIYSQDTKICFGSGMIKKGE